MLQYNDNNNKIMCVACCIIINTVLLTMMMMMIKEKKYLVYRLRQIKKISEKFVEMWMKRDEMK